MKRSPRPCETTSLSKAVSQQLKMYALAASAGVGVLALAGSGRQDRLHAYACCNFAVWLTSLQSRPEP